MTAIVGTINRRGVAFAADSAATHTTSSTSKISNTANKIFSLSSKNPVGIALYNNLDFHGLPWEELFKRYRDNHLKNKSFPKLTDYIDDFWKYMYKDVLKKIPRNDQESHVIINIIGLSLNYSYPERVKVYSPMAARPKGRFACKERLGY